MTPIGCPVACPAIIALCRRSGGRGNRIVTKGRREMGAGTPLRAQPRPTTGHRLGAQPYRPRLLVQVGVGPVQNPRDRLR